MKSIDELDHYELLEVAHTATPGEIDRAYRLAQQTYAEGSLALYSVFETMDAESIRARIDFAYQTLADPESRDAYNREFDFDASSSGLEESFASPRSDVSGSVESAISDSRHGLQSEDGSIGSIDDVVDEYDALEEEGGGDFDGVRLRRTRMFRGYELEDISDVTKVSGKHLRNIEEENFQDLPADVYVRGFVTAYAKTIGLDPNVVVPGYMARVEQSRAAGRPGRFLGRR